MKAVESIVIFVFLVFFGACLEEDLESPANESVRERVFPGVDPALWPHFRAFEDAALARGYRVDLAATNIVGTIEEIHEQNIAGSCSYGGRSNTKDVVVDKSFWDRANNLYREYIVFHELGHCYLFRDHLDACFANRTYVSLMRSGNGNCRDNYSFQTRDYYLDELFEPLSGP